MIGTPRDNAFRAVEDAGSAHDERQARRRFEELTPRPDLTDTERLDALFTVFGGNCAFSPFFEIARVFQKGRDGIDELIRSNPALAEKP